MHDVNCDSRVHCKWHLVSFCHFCLTQISYLAKILSLLTQRQRCDVFFRPVNLTRSAVRDEYGTVENYVNRMKQDGVFGDGTLLAKVPFLYRRNVVIHYSDRAINMCDRNMFESEPLHVGFVNNNHYVSILKANRAPTPQSESPVVSKQQCDVPQQETAGGRKMEPSVGQQQQQEVGTCGWGVKAGMVCVWVSGKTV